MREECDVRAIVVSESEDSHVPLYETVATIARFLPAIEVIALPRLATRRGSSGLRAASRRRLRA